jgi:hypothetical protein
MTRRITAVELDDILGRLGAALARLSPQQRDELRASMPADIMACADQALAAQAQSVAATKLTEGDRLGWIPRDDIDAWVRLGTLDALLGWLDGRGRTCMHSPSHHRPQPVFAAAWRPGLVVCAQCLHLLDVTGPASMVCDCCGRACEGTDADDPVFCGAVWLGELCYQWGACTDCRPSLEEGVA